MRPLPRCPACGLPLPEDRLPGLCPACAWQGLLETEEEPRPDLPGSGDDLVMRLPGYEVVGEIARGGMGIVYRARQLEPRRSVALKMLLPGRLAGGDMTERFRLEVRALTELEHPAILPVYQVGEYEGLPFFTMKLATGGTLAARRGQYAGKWRECARLMAALAEAVQFAHEHGVLHRDLKPGNILFDEQERPYVSDFGLAKLADAEANLTRSVDFLGTPHYVAPEVAERSARLATIASDVYSLGAILYELLAGHPPFEAESLPRLLRKIAEDEPVPPSAAGKGDLARFGRDVPRDLEVICLKCLNKEPGRRYPSAGEFQADLNRWLEGRPILARPATALERAARWAHRNPTVAALSVALVLALAVAGVVMSRANRSLRRAAMDSRHSLYRALIAQVRALRQSGRAGHRYEALEALRQAAGIERTGELRDEAAAVLAEPDLRLTNQWPVYWGTSLGVVEFTPDLQGYLEGDTLGGFSLRSTSDRQMLKHFNPGIKATALRFRFSQDSSRLAVWFNDGSVQLWNRDGSAPWLRLSGSSRVPAQVDFNPDGRQLAVSQPNQGLRLLSLGDNVWTTLDPSATNVLALHYDPAGHRLSVTSERSMQVLAGEPHRPLWTLEVGGSKGSGVWSGDGRFLEVIDDSKMEILILEAETGAVITRFAGHATSPVQVQFHPDGELVASIGLDRTLRLWETTSGREVLRTDSGHCVALRFSPDGNRLAAAPADVVAGIYELAPSVVFRELRRRGWQRSWASSIACSSNGQFLLTSEDAGIRLWDTQSACEQTFIPFPGTDHATVFFDESSQSIIYSRQKVGTFQRGFCWKEHSGNGPAEITLGEEKQLPVPLKHWLLSIGGSRPGSEQGKRTAERERLTGREPRAWLIGGSGTGFEVWPGGEQRRAQVVNADVRHGFVYGSADGRWVAKPRAPALGLDIWDMQDHQRMVSLTNAPYSIARFSPDGRWLVAGSLSSYEFRHVESWKPGPMFPADLGGFEHGEVVFSADGRLAALRSRPEVFELVALPEPHELVRLEPPAQLGTMNCALSPDGAHLWIVAHGARVFEWNLPQLRAELSKLGLDW